MCQENVFHINLQLLKHFYDILHKLKSCLIDPDLYEKQYLRSRSCSRATFFFISGVQIGILQRPVATFTRKSLIKNVLITFSSKIDDISLNVCEVCSNFGDTLYINVSNTCISSYFCVLNQKHFDLKLL